MKSLTTYKKWCYSRASPACQNIIERDTYYQRESISNIAQEIGYVMTTTNDIKIYDNYVANIKKVTPADVKRVADKYLGKINQQFPLSCLKAPEK